MGKRAKKHASSSSKATKSSDVSASKSGLGTSKPEKASKKKANDRGRDRGRDRSDLSDRRDRSGRDRSARDKDRSPDRDRDRSRSRDRSDLSGRDRSARDRKDRSPSGRDRDRKGGRKDRDRRDYRLRDERQERESGSDCSKSEKGRKGDKFSTSDPGDSRSPLLSKSDDEESKGKKRSSRGRGRGRGRRRRRRRRERLKIPAPTRVMPKVSGDTEPGMFEVPLPLRAKPYWHSRVFCAVNADFPDPPSRYFQDQYNIELGSYGDYEVNWEEAVGRGGFGEVYLAESKDKTTVVAKVSRADKGDQEDKFRREYMMLDLLKDGKNILQIVDAVKDDDNRPVLILEYINNPRYNLAFRSMSDYGARLYMYKLLQAIAYTHSMGVIHRDIKCGNVLYDPETQNLRLIDWNLAAFYMPNYRANGWPGTREYRAPESILKYPGLDYSSDMWSVGCVLAFVLFNRSIFKRKSDAKEAQMATFVSVLGTEEYKLYLSKFKFRKARHYAIHRLARVRKRLRKERTDWKRYINSRNEHKCTPEALDLLNILLVFDHEQRATAREAMNHPYFDLVRQNMSDESGDSDKGTSSGGRCACRTCVCCGCRSKSRKPRALTSSLIVQPTSSSSAAQSESSPTQRLSYSTNTAKDSTAQDTTAKDDSGDDKDAKDDGKKKSAGKKDQKDKKGKKDATGTDT